MTTPRFLVTGEALAAGSVVLTGSELRHLRVRRLRAGSEVIVSDGRGGEKHGVILAIDRRQAVIRLASEQVAPRESPLRLILAQALLKADKVDELIARATELGVSEVALFTSSRTLGRCSADRLARWGRIAGSAAKQCQRSTVPRITGILSFADLLAWDTTALRVLLWEEAPPGGLGDVHRDQPRISSLLIVIGPEGGFTPAEAAQAAAAGFHTVGLTRRILRAETAALAAVTLGQFLWGDFASSDRRFLASEEGD